MALTTPTRDNSRNGRPSPIQAGSPLPTRERRPGYVALAVVLIVGLAAVGAWLYVNAGKKVPVIVVKKDVPVGQVIQREDLTTASVAGGISAMKAERISEVAGQTAAVTLVPDTVLLPTMIHTGPVLPAGTAQVGVALKPGQLPADSVAPGDRVSVLRMPADDDAQGDPSRISDSAVVAAVRTNPAESGGTLLTLTVPGTSAADIAFASASGRIAVIRIPAG